MAQLGNNLLIMIVNLKPILSAKLFRMTMISVLLILINLHMFVDVVVTTRQSLKPCNTATSNNFIPPLNDLNQLLNFSHLTNPNSPYEPIPLNENYDGGNDSVDIDTNIPSTSYSMVTRFASNSSPYHPK